MSKPYVCPMIERFCKRGHLRTKEATFERKVRSGSRDYIVRECRICHALRNTRLNVAPRRSKWKRFLTAQEDSQ